MRSLSLLLVLPACTVSAFGDPCQGSFDPACLGGCPDADDDGVCDDDDVCPQGDDGIDADDDGTPDACDDDGGPDDCPDADDDGVCDDDEDPCAEGEDCTETIQIGVQADLFPEDLTWNVVDDRGGLVRDGSPGRAPGGGGFTAVQVEAGALTCFTLRDSARDGGGRGLVFSRQRQEWYLEFEGDESESGYSRCFTPGQGRRFSPPTEEAWLAEGACTVEIVIDPGNYPAEVGWALEKARPDRNEALPGRAVIAVATGSYFGRPEGETVPQPITDGTYWVRMFDRTAAGSSDGWSNDGASIQVRIQGGPTLVSASAGVLPYPNAEGVVEFVIDCG